MTKEQARELGEQFIALNGQEAAERIIAWVKARGGQNDRSD
jgi:hypothetical protein